MEPYGTTDTDETMSTQSDKTIPYMLDSERDYDDLSAGTNSVDQQNSFPTKSGRVTKIPEHLNNFVLQSESYVNIQTETGQHHILLMLKKRTLYFESCSVLHSQCNKNDKIKNRYIEYRLQNIE